MTDLEMRAIAWRNGDDTGLSSIALVCYLMGWPVSDRGFRRSIQHPLDPADFGRCIRALDVLPELRSRLHEASEMSPTWAALIAKWGEIEALYHQEFPTSMAPKCYALMKQIQREASAET
ncbi:MAG: hypothetical protein NVSMB31_09880 [Vulcanimicrobiaceae bacterium]